MPDPKVWPIDSSDGRAEAVGVASAVIMAANADRGDTDITNVSNPSEPIYLKRGATAVMGEGIPLMARGSSYHIGTNNMWYGTIEAICTSGEASVAISEGNA